MQFEFDPAKDIKLMQERGISFEDAKRAYRENRVLFIENNSHAGQEYMVFRDTHKGKSYIFTCVIEKKEKDIIRLITIFPDRKNHKKYGSYL